MNISSYRLNWLRVQIKKNLFLYDQGFIMVYFKMNALVVPLSPQGYSASNAIVRLKKVGQGKTRQDCCKIWALKPVLQLATLH